MTAIHPIHAAAGVGFGTSRVAQQHRSVPGGWLASMKYFIEELGIDPNIRDKDGYAPLHHAAARGDNETILRFASSLFCEGGELWRRPLQARSEEPFSRTLSVVRPEGVTMRACPPHTPWGRKGSRGRKAECHARTWTNLRGCLKQQKHRSIQVRGSVLHVRAQLHLRYRCPIRFLYFHFSFCSQALPSWLPLPDGVGVLG